MKTLKSAAILLTLLTNAMVFSACDQTVKIKDGQIPNEYIPYVQKVVGTYRGQMENRATGLVASLDGNRLVLTSTDDILGKACESKIGDLIEFSYKETENKNMVITGAIFQFDGNLCKVDGTKLVIDLVDFNTFKFDARILDHIDHEYICDSVPPTPYNPAPNCHWRSVGWYNVGRFIKN